MCQNDHLLRDYLKAHPCHHEYRETWPIQGEMIVHLSLADSLPPRHVSSSILAIVLDSDQNVLFLWPDRSTGNIAHLLIGGRPEPGETPEQTAIREVGEETGWRVRPIRMIGFRHFHQIEPRSENTDRPYPDFIQPIYAARAEAFEPGLLLQNDQIPCELRGFGRTEQAIEPAQRPLLYAAANDVRHCVD